MNAQLVTTKHRTARWFSAVAAIVTLGCCSQEKPPPPVTAEPVTPPPVRLGEAPRAPVEPPPGK